MGQNHIKFKKIPEKYITLLSIVMFVMLSILIIKAIRDGERWECVKKTKVTKVWEDQLQPKNSSTEEIEICSHLKRVR